MTSCGCSALAGGVVFVLALAAFLTSPDRSEPEYLLLTPLLAGLLVFGVLSLLDRYTG